jgi:hypothetical protein
MKARIRIVTSKSLFGLCRLGILLVGLVGLFVVAGQAQALMGQQQTITQSDGLYQDSFGSSVAMSSDGNTVIVGAPEYEPGTSNNSTGSATIFTSTSGVWTQQQTITQSPLANGARFGSSVAMSSDGTTAIIGAPGNGNGPGNATVFTRSSGVWTQQQTISQTGSMEGDWFGRSVALSSDGNTAIVGSYGGAGPNVPNQGNPMADPGKATVFTRSGSAWTQQQVITKTDGVAGDRFGVSVALSSDGNTAIVGDHMDDVGAMPDQGSAIIFIRSEGVWTQQQLITKSDGTGSDQFGSSVALSSDGNTAIITTQKDDVGRTRLQGSATIFTRSGSVWTQQQTITRTGGGNTDYFGASVALSGDGNTVIAGQYGDPNNGIAGDPGSATVFTRSGSTWTQQQIITKTGGAYPDFFGYAVALSSDGTTAIIGAIGDEVGNGAGQGSATIFATATTAPGVPTSVSASSGANGQSVVSWTAPVNTGGATITGYTVTASPGGQTCPWTSGALTCTVTGLTNGTNYTFTVTATNLAGTSSASSASAAALPGFTLTLSTFSGSGTVTNATGTMSCISVCITNQADSATITATPANGWVFSSWGGACSGATRVCSLLMNQARDVTVFFVEAPASTPPSGGGSGAAPSPTINISNNVTVNVTVTTPVNVQWSPTVVGQPTTASFTAAPATTYSISATTVARAAKTVRGSCTVKASKAMCTIKIPAKGKWVVAITPKKKGKVGKPAKKTVKV